MNEASRTRPRAPVGSLILIGLMYLPWLRYFLASHSASDSNGDMEFPGGFILVGLGLGYLITAIILPICLYRRRDLSVAHTIAFWASLGILALLSTLIWSAS